MIRKCIVIGILFTAVLQVVTLADARRARKWTQPDDILIEVETPGVLDLDLPSEHQRMKATAQADTFVLAYWTFDWGGGCVEEGWTTSDLSEQPGAFFHIDDFAGLGGGSYGYLEPLEGSQSAWCGARPDAASPILCGYATLPGYGNDWDQSFCFKCIDVPDTEKIYIDYLVSWNSESGWDYSYTEYATKGTCDSLSNLDFLRPEDWIHLASFDGTGMKQLRTDTIPAGHAGFLTVRFRFDSDGGWSDEDGLYDTDGAIVVDSITVRSETATYDFEDFEDESPGDIATTDGDWRYRAQSDYGDYAALFPGVTQVQEDPCKFDFSCLWTFINGSMETYACGGFPGQLAVPNENERGQYIWNEIWSPPVALTGTGSTVELAFDVYRDLPLKNLVFYKRRVRQWIGGFPGRWSSTASYYGSARD
ncbi:MAG: hypothetical protein GTO51_05580 [Candidatus Latescibacteria bacterium]|nr:hypothetical protein [Candidatus Latescibacterota bacterium]NIO28475.1 hypothetical protein [Candidatus Latescibacterota bacterium]NIO56024.1 hypothetical protein [Candidatus Latescibacterota bacterium]NIT01988.1 hypothetical protein [Candidatus Latescibacterota bacterium]